jgi:hypothetical protein
VVLLTSATLPAAAQDVLTVINDAVGIGTDTPDVDSKLHVKAATGGGAINSILLENNAPARIALLNTAITNTATKDQFWTLNGNGDLRFTACIDGAEMRLDAAGNSHVPKQHHRRQYDVERARLRLGA